MATRAEATITAALAQQGYFVRLVAWMGGEKGWLIQYSFLDQPGAYIEQMTAPSVSHALSKIAWLGPNTTR